MCNASFRAKNIGICYGCYSKIHVLNRESNSRDFRAITVLLLDQRTYTNCIIVPQYFAQQLKAFGSLCLLSAGVQGKGATEATAPAPNFGQKWTFWGNFR